LFGGMPSYGTCVLSCDKYKNILILNSNNQIIMD